MFSLEANVETLQARKDGSLMLQEIKEARVNILQLTPSHWALLPAEMEECLMEKDGFLGFCGGEAMPRKLGEVFSRAKASILQMYGPTEATIWATVSRFAETKGVAGIERVIGKAMTNTHASVVDGELYLAGPAVAKGYRNLPEITNEKFIECYGQKTYKTGDLVKWMDDREQLIFLGRKDLQVKVRGYRIEPEEIEACLGTHHAVSCCAVVPHRDLLVAFIVPSESRSKEKELRELVANSLEQYKIPTEFKFLDHFELTSSGKVDRRRLSESLHGETPSPSAPDIQKVLEDVIDVNSLAKHIRTLLAKYKGNAADIGLEDDIVQLGMTSQQIKHVCEDLKKTRQHLKPSPSDFFGAGKTCTFLAQELVNRLRKCNSAKPVQNHPELLPELLQRPLCGVSGLAIRTGKADCAREFWENLLVGRDCITEFQDEELKAMNISTEDWNSERYVSCKGVIRDFACFDAKFFDMSTHEAQELSPLHRCFLECAVNALEDAGWQFGKMRSRIGILAGMGDHDYLKGGFANAESLRLDLANSKDFLASRVAYLLNLSGPSMSIQTACSSGLVAVATARNMMLSRGGAEQCKEFLAGAVSLAPLTPGYLAGEDLQFAARGRHSRCKTFSSDADGIVVGSLLK